MTIKHLLIWGSPSPQATLLRLAHAGRVALTHEEDCHGGLDSGTEMALVGRRAGRRAHAGRGDVRIRHHEDRPAALDGAVRDGRGCADGARARLGEDRT